MPKLLLIFVNVLALLAYNLFFGGDVSIDQKMPDQIKAGDTFEIQISIEKGDRDGFAKWQQALPEGFIAEAKETKGGTFSFKNQEVKLIWMAIPKEEQFTISYTIKVDPNMQGTFEINGKYSYIEDNDRKDVNSAVKQLTVVVEGEALVEEEVQEVEPFISETVEEDATVEEVIEIEETTASIEDGQETIAYADEDVTIKRVVKETGIAKYEVTLTIEKGDLNSFGKIEEFIPENFTASSMENSDGMFSFKDNIMKVLWMTLPSDETLTVAYSMESLTNEVQNAEVTGLFSFLDVDESKQVELGSTNFKNTYIGAGEENKSLAEADEIIDEVIEEIVTEEEVIEEERIDEIEETVEQVEEIIAVVESDFPSPTVANSSFVDNESIQNEQKTINEADPIEEIQENNEEQLVAEITNVPAPESNVNYKVQIAAGKKEVNQQYFVARHNVTENVAIEYHEGWYKYTVGGYPIYREARDRRNEIWAAKNKINDAFVTAYNSGERISVQEALMITKQKWYK